MCEGALKQTSVLRILPHRDCAPVLKFLDPPLYFVITCCQVILLVSRYNVLLHSVQVFYFLRETLCYFQQFLGQSDSSIFTINLVLYILTFYI